MHDKIQEQVKDVMAELAANSLEPLTILGSIHNEEHNDAQVVACIAQNIFALSSGFFELLYDQFIIEEMLSGPFIDIDGKERRIQVLQDNDETFIEDGVLYIGNNVWLNNDIKGDTLKNIIGRYLLGIHLDTSKKIALKHSKALELRIKAEFTKFSNELNQKLYSYDIEHLQALALTLSEIGIKYILPLFPNFCNDKDIEKMFGYAYDSIVNSMDEPSDQPLIRAFNSAVPNSLFLDMRAGNLYRICISSQSIASANDDYKRSLELDYMTRCMALVNF